MSTCTLAMAAWGMLGTGCSAQDFGGRGSVFVHVSPRGDDGGDGTGSRPFASLPRALAELETLASRSYFVPTVAHVVLAEGRHELHEPLEIGPEHGGNLAGIVFEAATGAHPTISGGRLLEGFTPDPQREGFVMLHSPKVARGEWTFRELFVGGRRLRRARHPAAGYLRVQESLPDQRSGFRFAPGDLPEALAAVADPAEPRPELELVFLHDWSVSRTRVARIDAARHTLFTQDPIGDPMEQFRIGGFEPHPRYFLEGHPAFLGGADEWCLDPASGCVRYSGPSTDEVVAPHSRGLLSIRGSAEQPVRNLSFHGITFAHSAWPLPPGGFAEAQATWHEPRDPAAPGERRMVDAAIVLERAQDCEFRDCRFEHLGGSGLWLGTQTRACRLLRCDFADVSGNSLMIGEDASRRVDGKPWWEAAPHEAAEGNEVADCRIVQGGVQCFGAVAVWVGLAHAVHIHHNEIAEHPYTGISLGWMWNPTPTPAGGHVVEHNHIHHVMQVLSDGGGIYTLGRQPGTVLRGNSIHDVPLNAGRAESNGMFLDEGTDQIVIEGNVVAAVARSPLRFHRAQHNQVKDNVFVVPDAQTPPIQYNATDPQTIEQSGNQVLEQGAAGAELLQQLVPEAGPRERR